MRNRSRTLLLSAAAIIFVALAGSQARADIVYLPGQTAPQGGVGHQPESVLSIQSPGNTSNAAGGVSWNGSKACATRGQERRAHKTLTFAQAGITNAGQLRIFMDTEDQDNDLTLNQLVLTAYGTNGQVLFQGSLVAPITAATSRTGRGTQPRLRPLIFHTAALLQAAFNANKRASASSPRRATTRAPSPTSSSARVPLPSPNRRP